MNDIDHPGQPPSTFEQIVRGPGNMDLANFAAIVDVPSPWDDLVANSDWQNRRDRQAELRDAINHDENPAVRGQLWSIARAGFDRPPRVGDRESVALAARLLRAYPNPGDLLAGPIAEAEESLVAMAPDERDSVRRFYTVGPAKDQSEAATHLAQLDDEIRQQATERLLEILYGDRYAAWKKLNSSTEEAPQAQPSSQVEAGGVSPERQAQPRLRDRALALGARVVTRVFPSVLLPHPSQRAQEEKDK